MDDALAAGDECFVFLGDSRMVAGFDSRSLHLGLRQTAAQDRCLINIAIGASDISGQFLALREFFRHGGRPRALILGKVGDALLSPAPPIDRMVGNNAIHLTWTDARDVFAEVHGFPFENVGTFDEGFRFLWLRASVLGRYQSLIWSRVQQLQATLTGEGREPQNAFGNLSDMAALELGLRTQALGRLNAAASLPGGPVGPWFRALLGLVDAKHVPLVVVELPMPSGYRAQIQHSPQFEAYQGWLGRYLRQRSDRLVDLSQEQWIADGLFVDQLHLGSHGAAMLSAALGKQLGEVFPR
jgi:hypothetical protein